MWVPWSLSCWKGRTPFTLEERFWKERSHLWEKHVERQVLTYLQSNATDPEWETHLLGILRQPEPARTLLKVLIAHIAQCENGLLQGSHGYALVLNPKSRQEMELVRLWFHFLWRLDVSSFSFICLRSCIISIISIWSQKAQHLQMPAIPRLQMSWDFGTLQQKNIPAH